MPNRGKKLPALFDFPIPAGAHWWVLAVTLALFGLVAAFVDLKPVVDQSFFFSSRDPSFRQSSKIEKRFPSRPELILAVAAPDISSERYLSRISRLTRQIHEIDQVAAVKSLAEGPKNYPDASESPFWSRLLLANNRKSSNVIVFLEGRDLQKPIRQLERIAQEMDGDGFRIHLAGAPYVVEQIRRSLAHDFWYFTLTAVLLFGLTMAVMFRSLRIFIGMLATCTSAVLLTLLLRALLGQKIGVLTVNLGTIVFIITLSHLVYMTFNWQTLAKRESELPELALAARRMTLPASFWSMICSALGFGSLLLVQAQPLRELGFGGVLGTVVAFCSAYLLYPPFLRSSAPKQTKLLDAVVPRGFWEHRFVVPSLIIILLGSGLAFGLTRLETDPSLLAYFKPNEKLRDDLEYVDRHGGSNPLELVVSAAGGGTLTTDDAYRRMWSFQRALEDDKDVGTVISLPTLLAEGDRTPFSFFLSYETITRILEEPKHARIAKSFVSDDRAETLFLIRMNESRRTQPRLVVVNKLRAIARRHGFATDLVGGVYYLQGRLAKLVASSLVTGLFWLNLFFVAIAWLVARSWRGALAMIASLLLVPLYMLGAVGWFHVPVDIISAPATNVCIGIAIDSMIHLVFGVRRAEATGKNGWAAWVAGRREQWRGIVYSDVIFAAGFAIFALSDFPPTQRFGLIVLGGTIIDILANLFVLPLLGGAGQGEGKLPVSWGFARPARHESAEM
ncbi:MAG TPA: MMPL family transporter [Chthoniobacterales bacterium]